MKSFKNYNELLKEIGAFYKSDYVYANNELKSFVECIGSDPDPEPISYFTLEFNGIEYEIGVTSREIEKDQFEDTYWVMDIVNLNGKKWKDVKEVLEKYVTIDMENFGDEGGIVDFTGIYTDFSIKGYLVHYDDEVSIEIDDNAEIYRNN